MTDTMHAPITRTNPYRRPAWLMVGSFVAFIAWIASAIALLAGAGVTDSGDLTPDKMASIRVGWLAVWALYAIAVGLGALSMARLAAGLRTTGARWTATGALVAAVASTAAILVHFVLSASVSSFTAARLADVPAWKATMALSMAAMWLTLLANVLGGLALRRSGVLR